MNSEEIQKKLYEKLIPSGWGDVLKPFIMSDDFIEILKELYKCASRGERFTPPLKYVFRAFEECPYEDLRVIFIGQDPYPKLGVADGISFSCSLTKTPQPSLRYMFWEIERTVFQEFPSGQNPDLTRWANQGILMLNTALTCEVGRIGSHISVWKPFTEFLLTNIVNRYTGIVYVLLGKKAEEWEHLIDAKNNYILKCSHPASAAYNRGKWDSNNIFTEISKIIENTEGLNITW